VEMADECTPMLAAGPVGAETEKAG
jgi:hypothetical protein